MYDIRHRLIWAISGFVSALSLLVLMTLAGYGLFKALLLSLLILALVALVLWILWVSEPESLVDILAPPRPELAPPTAELMLPNAPMVDEAAVVSQPHLVDTLTESLARPAAEPQHAIDEGADHSLDEGRHQAEAEPDALAQESALSTEAIPADHASAAPGAARPALATRPGQIRPKAGSRGDGRTAPRRAAHDRAALEPILDAEEIDAPPEADDLLQISGIDPRIGAGLERLGITRFAQIAALDAPEIARIEAELGCAGHILAEDWPSQAKALLAALAGADEKKKD